jgi:hypothetical protein
MKRYDARLQTLQWSKQQPRIVASPSAAGPRLDAKRKSGRKPRFDHLIVTALTELFEWHGDLQDDDKEWSIQADVERAVRAKLGDKAPSAVSTVRKYVSKFIADRKKPGGEGR